MPPEQTALSGSAGLRIRVGPHPARRPEHKRLMFTAGQWRLLAGLGAAPLPPPLRPAPAPGDRVDAAGGPVEGRLRAAGVLTDSADPTPSPEVVQSLALLAASPVAVHVIVAGVPRLARSGGRWTPAGQWVSTGVPTAAWTGSSARPGTWPR